MGTLALNAPLIDYSDHVALLREQDAELARQVADFTGIVQVVEWMTVRNSTRADIDMIGMDEFEYDFLMELAPDDRWLSFGVT